MNRTQTNVGRSACDADVLAIDDGYRVRRRRARSGTGIPFVRGGNIGDGGIDFDVADAYSASSRTACESSKLTCRWRRSLHHRRAPLAAVGNRSRRSRRAFVFRTQRATGARVDRRRSWIRDSFSTSHAPRVPATACMREAHGSTGMPNRQHRRLSGTSDSRSHPSPSKKPSRRCLGRWTTRSS